MRYVNKDTARQNRNGQNNKWRIYLQNIESLFKEFNRLIQNLNVNYLFLYKRKLIKNASLQELRHKKVTILIKMTLHFKSLHVISKSIQKLNDKPHDDILKVFFQIKSAIKDSKIS